MLEISILQKTVAFGQSSSCIVLLNILFTSLSVKRHSFVLEITRSQFLGRNKSPKCLTDYAHIPRYGYRCYEESICILNLGVGNSLHRSPEPKPGEVVLDVGKGQTQREKPG